MIRINLLPIGRRPIEEKIRREIFIFFGLTLLSVAIMGWFHVGHSGTIKKISNEKRQIDSEVLRYQDRQKQLKELEQKQDLLKQKLRVIDSLRQNRDLPVRVLNEIASRIPSDKMWIRSLTHKGGLLNLEGVARGNETIAQFMETLAESPYIDANGVVLKQSRQVNIQGYKLKNFNLTCKIIVPTPEKEESTEKGKEQKM